jgi:dihydroorotate dehydrogenase (NAD+) catalytic subunit
MAVDLRTRLAALELANPVVVASGCGGPELAGFCDVPAIGAVTTPSVMADVRAGGPAPRILETPSGLLHATGLPGPGVEAFIAEELPWYVEHAAEVIVSIAGGTVGEYVKVAERFSATSGLAAIEVNISCPNVADRGLIFADSAREAAAVIRAVRPHVRLPLFAKLSADAGDVMRVAMACVDAGADGLTVINSPSGMAIDGRSGRPTFAGVTGGLSGPAIRPLALRCVYQVHSALPEVPIIGTGGVLTARDAAEFLFAGASAVGVGTAVLHDPAVCARILADLPGELGDAGTAGEVIGVAHRPVHFRPPFRSAPGRHQGGRDAVSEETRRP